MCLNGSALCERVCEYVLCEIVCEYFTFDRGIFILLVIGNIFCFTASLSYL